MFNYTNFKSSTIGSSKMRVEIFTLARGARACIESTQFIIMTFFNKLSRLDACPSATREGKNFNTHFWAAYGSTSSNFSSFRLYFQYNHSFSNALSARIWIVSSTGTLVKSDATSYDTRMSPSAICFSRNSSANFSGSETVYSLIERNFNFSSNHLAILKL